MEKSGDVRVPDLRLDSCAIVHDDDARGKLDADGAHAVVGELIARVLRQQVRLAHATVAH